MTKKDYLLQKLQEECAEIIVIASKYNCFGPESFHPDDPKKVTNAQNLARELMDLMAVIQMVGAEGILPEMSPKQAEEAINNKIHKVEYYMESSRDCGRLDPEEKITEATD